MPRNVRKRPLSGTADPAPRPYEAANASLARRAATEGFVLLENKNNLLPLSPKAPLALFGAGATHTVKGGTGSGDVNERASVSIRQGLVEAGFSLTTDQWLDDCEARYAAARQAWKQEVLADARVREQAGELSAFFMAYSARPFLLPAGGDVYATEAEVAVYVLARVAGEGADRQAGPGDYALSAEEHAQLADLCRLYRHVVLLINAGGVVDLSCLDEFPAIEAVLVISQPGMEGGRAVADVLSGAVNPSGKLTDTWAFRYADYPNAATFSHNNGNVEQEIYQEGLYVGYRYFDSFEIAVRYGFGFGLSYTEFELDDTQVACAADGTVLVKVAVTNAGKRAGREVVQLYAGLPDGKLEKEARRLIAFAKTGLLAPGETEVLTLSFGPECLESYDEVAAAWILEPGIYGLYLGDSLAESGLVAALDLPAAKILTKTETICPPEAPVETLCLPANRRAARYAAMCLAAKGVPVLPYDLSAVAPRIVSYSTDEAPDEASRLVDALSVDQLVCLATGEPSKGQGAEEAGETGGALGSAGAAVPGGVGMAGGVMQRCGIDFDKDAGRHPEGLDLAGVELAAFDIVFAGQQKDEILGAKVEFAVTVVFQAVELGVVAVAPAELDRHAAIQGHAQRGGFGQALQRLFFRHIVGGFGQGGVGVERCHQGGAFGFIAGHNPPVRGEFRRGNRIDGHGGFLRFK